MPRLQLDARAIVRGYKAGMTSRALARKFGCGKKAVLCRLHEAGVVMRPARQVPDPKKFNAQKLTELIDGLLLGDGSMERRFPGRISINQNPIRIGWLKHIQRQLAAIGIRSRISEPSRCAGGRRAGGKLKGKVFKATVRIRLHTLTYDVIKAHYARWYPGGKKHVPVDLRLTPIVVTHWFCGDGGGNRRAAELRLYTNGFERHEVDRLAAKLSRYGFSAVVSVYAGKPIIRLNAEAARKFKREIWRLLPRCCRYKVAGVTPRPERMGYRGRLTRRTVHAIRHGDPKSAAYRKLTAKYGVSKGTRNDIRCGWAYAGYDFGSPR